MQEREIVYKIKNGSHLYGTMVATSDIDYASVFLPTVYDLLSLQKCNFIDNSTKASNENRRNTADDVDDHMYALPWFVHLGLQGNPTVTEMLFCANPVIEDAMITNLKNNYDKFVSLKVYDSFTGFAISQKKKLEYKSKRFTQLQKSVDYLEDKYTQDQLLDTKEILNTGTSEWLNNNLSEYKGKKNDVSHFHSGLPLAVIYEKIKSEYENYGWRCHTDSFKEKNYDIKFGAHAIRLLHEGQEILSTGKLTFPIKGKAYDDIMSIRNGEVSIEQFYVICEEYENASRKAREQSKLPEQANWKWVNNWLVETTIGLIKSGAI